MLSDTRFDLLHVSAHFWGVGIQFVTFLCAILIAKEISDVEIRLGSFECDILLEMSSPTSGLDLLPQINNSSLNLFVHFALIIVFLLWTQTISFS